MSRFLISLWEKKIRTCPDFDFSLKNKNIWRSLIFDKVFDKKNLLLKFFFCPIFLFLKEEFKSGQVQIFFFKEKLKIWTCPDLSFSKQKKNLDFASNNTFNDGWVQIWNFQLKIKNLDTSEFFIFKVKKKIWTRPDFYFLMQKFKSGLGDM